ncbi:MAG: zinc ribbon domain-containing protein [Bacilli bacterium]|nr:zinc ribbon domain-containing protein [Bacilli bacterium]
MNKYCTNCGFENNDSAQFCTNCGNTFEVNTKPKKKKGKGCLIALIIILLIAGLIVGGIFLYKKFIYFEDPFVDETIITNNKSLTGKLEDDLNNGRITKDEYIKQLAYSIKEPVLINESYSDLDNDFNDINYLFQKANEMGNDLSDETIKYLFDIYMMDDVIWDVKEDVSYEDDSTYKYEVQNVKKTNGGSINKLDHVKLSKNGNFLVYYSTDGRNAISNTKAKKIANYLEDVVSYYKSEYGYDFKYEQVSNPVIDTYDLFTKLNKPTVSLLLTKNGIDTKYLDTAMPIYIIDTDKDITGLTAWYCQTMYFSDQLLAKAVDIRYDNMELDTARATYAFPYVVVSSTAFDNLNNTKVVVGHELFHHYQHYICGNNSYGNCKSGLFTLETTADLSGLKASKITKNVPILNSHAVWYIEGTETSIDKIYTQEHGLASIGYPAYIFAYNYANIVPNGEKILHQSGKYENTLEYLEDNSSGAFGKVMVRMGEKNLTRDYDNKALIPTLNGEPVYPANHYNLKAPTAYNKSSYFLNRSVEPAAINYYYFNTSSYTDKTYIQLGPDSLTSSKFDNATILFFVKENGKYKKVYSSNEKMIFNVDDFGYYDEVVLAVVSTTSKISQKYEFLVKDTEEILDIQKEYLITAKGLGLKTNDQKKKGINDKNATTSKIVCSKVENEEYIKSTYQILVSFDNNDEVNDLYVKGTVEMDEDNPAFKIAKTVTSGLIIVLKQKYKEQFGKITLRTYDEGNKYIILGRIKDDYYTALKNSFDKEVTTKEEIFDAIQNEGYTCQYK